MISFCVITRFDNFTYRLIASGHIIARTQDTPFANYTQHILHHPAREGPATFRSNPFVSGTGDTNFSAELPAPGLWYTAFPDTVTVGPERNASFEEVGWNSAGLVVSATETIASNNATLEADPMDPNGITEENIPSLILPQATAARQAVQLLGSYIQRYGSGEGFGCMFADAQETWYFESAGGHLWLAQHVPDDAFFVTANQGRFQEADLSDTASVLTSPGLLEFAVAHGLHNASSGTPFNWLRSFIEDTEHDRVYNYPRVAFLQARFVRGDTSAAGPFFPVFQQPAQPLGVLDVMDGLRLHYQGTPHDPYGSQNPREPWRPVAVLRTSQAHVTRLRTDPSLPDPLSIITYICATTPFLAPFVPLYKGLPGDALPAALAGANGTAPDGLSLFWKARRLQALVFQDWRALGPRTTEAIRRWEADVEQRQRPAFEERFMQLWQAGQQQEAMQALVSFTHDMVRQAGQLLDELAVAAAAQQGRNGLPPDGALAPMLWEASLAYLFHGA
ncbi:hypothetical protein ABPG75_004861 [Micractinium tetrahymenae]